MSFLSVGDMAQSFVSQRQNFALKTRLATLSSELASGQVSDVAAKLGAQSRQLIGLDYETETTKAFLQNAQRAAQDLGSVQIHIGEIDQTLQSFLSDLVLDAGAGEAANILRASDTATTQFARVVNALNSANLGQSVFGGTSEQAPMPDAETLLDRLRLAVLPAPDLAGLSASVDTWFASPTGFSAEVHTGTSRQIQIGQGATVDVPATADDPAIAKVLAAIAKVALADEVASTAGGVNVFLTSTVSEAASAKSGIVAVAALVGRREQTADEALSGLVARQNANDIFRNQLTSADPFETATKFQEVEAQLQTSFAITARLSRLSLLDYL